MDTVRGKDGRTYPARAATRGERARAITLAHHLVHRDDVSIGLAHNSAARGRWEPRPARARLSRMACRS